MTETSRISDVPSRLSVPLDQLKLKVDRKAKLRNKGRASWDRFAEPSLGGKEGREAREPGRELGSCSCERHGQGLTRKAKGITEH